MQAKRVKSTIAIYLLSVLSMAASAWAEELPSFAFSSERLRIPVTQVNEWGKFYQVELALTNPLFGIFELQNAQEVLFPAAIHANLSLANGILSLPVVAISGLGPNIQDYEVALAMVAGSDPLQFRLIRVKAANNNAMYELLAQETHGLGDLLAKSERLNVVLGKIAAVVDATPGMSAVIGQAVGPPCGGLDTPANMLSLPPVDVDMNGIPEDVGRMLEVSFAKDSQFLAAGRQYSLALPWQVVAFTSGDQLYVTIGVPETLTRMFYRDSPEYGRLMALARDYHRQLRQVVAQALQAEPGMQTQLDRPWQRADGSPFDVGETEIAATESQLKTRLNNQFIAPSVVLQGHSAAEVRDAIVNAMMSNTVPDMNRNGKLAEDDNSNEISDDQEVLRDAVGGFIMQNNPDMAAMQEMMAQAAEIWANGGSLQRWNVARTITVGNADSGGEMYLIETGQAFYGGMALGFGLHHIPAMPCTIAVWEDADGVHVSIMNPRFLFPYYFADVSLDPNHPMQARMGQLFQLFPGLVFNELAGVINRAVTDLGSQTQFQLAYLNPDKFSLVRKHVDDWLKQNPTLLITPAEVETLLRNWSQEQAHYTILDTRSAAHYAQAHIPYALNIPYQNIAKLPNLALLNPARQNLAYCYTGHTGQVSSTILNLLNLPTLNIEYGMMGWNLDALRATGVAAWDGVANYPVETEIRSASGGHAQPMLMAGVDDPVTILQMVADNYVNNIVRVVKPTLAASEVKTLVDNWPAKQAEYQLVSVTSAASYAIGHVPNAINIPWQELATTENLSKLDPAKTIIVSSDIGHAGQMASTVLNLLGYKASNLKFGMMDWNLDTLQARGVPAWNSAASTHPVTAQ